MLKHDASLLVSLAKMTHKDPPNIEDPVIWFVFILHCLKSIAVDGGHQYYIKGKSINYVSLFLLSYTPSERVYVHDPSAFPSARIFWFQADDHNYWSKFKTAMTVETFWTGEFCPNICQLNIFNIVLTAVGQNSNVQRMRLSWLLE